MQTIYYTTPNFIRHTGNVVDLAEYRRKLELTQEGSLAPQPREEICLSAGYEEEDREVPRLREIRPRRERKARRPLMMLDACASLCVVLMTITITLHVLMG